MGGDILEEAHGHQDRIESDEAFVEFFAVMTAETRAVEPLIAGLAAISASK